MSSDSDANDNGASSDANVVVRALQRVVPNVIRRNFALKFALILVIMGVVLAGIGFTATQTLSDEVEQDVRGEYERLATQQASIVERWVERNTVSTKLASQNDALNANRSRTLRLKTTLDSPYSALFGAKQLSLVSMEGDQPEVIAKTPSIEFQPVAVSETPQSWVTDLDLQNITGGQVRMSDVYTVDETPVVGFVSAVSGPTERYLVLEYPVEDLAGAIESEQSSTSQENHFTQIVNRDSVVQSDTRMVKQGVLASGVTSTYSNSETLDRARADGNATTGVRLIEDNPDVMGEAYAVGYAPVEVTGIDSEWVVLAHAPSSDLFGFVQTITLWGRIATVVGMLVIGLVGATVGYSTASSIDRLRRKTEQMEDGNLDVDISTSRIDSIGQLYDGFANMRDSLATQIDEAEQARKEAEVSRAEAMEMSTYLQETADEYAQIMQQCAAGDLTQRMEADGENEAMDRIAEEFNQMIDELEKTTGQLKSFADEVETAGDVVQTSSESVRDASEQVADSVQKISDDAYEQKERLQEISETMDGIADDLDAFAAEHDIDFGDSLERIEDIATTLNQVVDLSEETMSEAENVAGAAEEQAAELNEVTQRAEDLSRYARPLREVLDRFETESEHEFYFPTGPGSGEQQDADRSE